MLVRYIMLVLYPYCALRSYLSLAYWQFDETTDLRAQLAKLQQVGG